jgi:hypothetical protein
MEEPIVDMSPEQKRMRVEKLRAELLGLGYSVVKTDWLHMILDQATASLAMEVKNENRSQPVS